MIYTYQKSKLSKKRRAAREALLKEQRAIKKELKSMQSGNLVYTNSVPSDRSTAHIPSVGATGGVATRRDSPVYTGTEMIGIGQLHKSNAVPVFKQEDAQDLARMRR